MQLRWWNPVSWLVAGWREARSLFPWTMDGRRTSLYVAVLGAGPVLSIIGVQILGQARFLRRFELYDFMAKTFAASLFVVVLAISVGTGLNLFLKAGKDGFTGGAGSGDDVADAARDVAKAAANKASEFEDAAAPSVPPPSYTHFPVDDPDNLK